MRFKIISYLLWTPTNHAGLSELIFPSGPSITAFLWLLPLFGCRHFWFKTSHPLQLLPNTQPNTWIVSSQPCSHLRGKGRMVLKAAQQDATPNSPLPVPAGGWDRLHLVVSLAPRAADGICLVKLIKLLPALSDKRHSQVAVCLLSILTVSKWRKSVVFFLNVEKKIGQI